MEEIFLTYYPARRQAARRLRHESTEAEKLLWSRLRNRQLGGLKFRRQFPLMNFFADFCCLEKRLIIEIDGGHHGSQKEADEIRTAYLIQQGFRVLRFRNDEAIKDLESVCEKILDAVTPLP